MYPMHHMHNDICNMFLIFNYTIVLLSGKLTLQIRHLDDKFHTVCDPHCTFITNRETFLQDFSNFQKILENCFLTTTRVVICRQIFNHRIDCVNHHERVNSDSDVVSICGLQFVQSECVSMFEELKEAWILCSVVT